MSDRNDRDFEELFDSAAHRIHSSLPRGTRPSASVWNAVRSASPNVSNVVVTAETAPHPAVRPTSRRNRWGSRVIGTSQPDYLRWTSWLLVIAVVAAIGFGFYSINQDDPNHRQPSIAMAPTTPESADTTIASAFASPVAQHYDPAFACDVQPLTEEEVYRIVLNPYTGWYYNQYPEGTPYPDREEWDDFTSFYQSEYEAISSFVPVDDPEVAGPVMELANTFWNCLMTGTAFQVWSLMDPALVQYEILRQYPVIRDEATLKTHIAERGPRRFSDGHYSVYPNPGTPVPNTSSNHVEWIRMGYSANGNPWKAAVHIAFDPYGVPVSVSDLLIVRSPDGTRWLVSAYLRGN